MADFDTTGQEEITSEPRKTGDLVSPTTANETQEGKKRKPVVLVNGPNHTILDDEGDLEIRNKNYGFGIQISESGDISLLCGAGSGGKTTGTNATAGAANQGGGGGGGGRHSSGDSAHKNGAAGGSGIVIVRYPT